jgi:hypothetical protein
LPIEKGERRDGGERPILSLCFENLNNEGAKMKRMRGLEDAIAIIADHQRRENSE